MTLPARLLRAAPLVLVAACASTAPPPGGPPDAEAPELLAIVPDTGSVSVTPPRVVFRFDEVVSERPQGAATLAGLFLISPRDGEPRVDWDRKAIEVRPRRGWKANTVYTVTMMPGLQDLRGNVRTDGATAVFSTGATIPDTRVAGLAFDWVAERPLTRPIIEAIAPDSTTYVTFGDSVGRFTFRHLPAGRYLVRAFSDVNANRIREPREAWDSASVTIAIGAGTDTSLAPSVELLAFVRDTLGPRIQSVQVRDSVTLRVEFDKPLAVAAPLTAASFTLKAGPDSTPVAITLAEPARDAEARAAREREAESRRDTTTRADSLDRVRRADSLRVANQAVRPVPPNVRPPAAPTAPAGKAGAPGTARDTIRGPRPSRPAPDIAYELRLGAPLAAGTTYRLAVTGARNLLGFTGSADRAFTTPRPAPPDTARAARDSTGMLRPPADRVPPGTPARTPAGTPRKPGVKVPPPRPPASPAARPR